MHLIGQGSGKWNLTQENVNVYTLVIQTQNTSIYYGSTEDCALDRRKRSRGSNQPLSPSHHIATCVSRANRIVGLIKRTYDNKSKRNIIA